LMTSYANDVSYNNVLLDQLKPVLNKGDLVIGISGSGNSENVLRPIRYSNENGGIGLGICGYDGGKLKQIAQHSICADINDMQLSEDVHLIFGHMKRVASMKCVLSRPASAMMVRLV
jgi:D-sedoheptulose 7-phosphate isomerase